MTRPGTGGFERPPWPISAGWALNTLGIHTNATMLTHPPGQARFPFVAPYEPLVLSHYLKPQPEAYADVFAPEFEAQCERTAERVAAPYRDDPMVLGYCMADCPPLTDNEAEWNGSTTWPCRLRNFAAEAPGKQAYVDSMRERYGGISGFNATYDTRFGAWRDLLRATDWRPDQAPLNQAERDDNAAFLLVCVDRYYSVARAALRRADPNHLFLGDKINGDTDGLNSIAAVTSQYTDLVNTQHYARWEGQRETMDRLTDTVGQPFLNGDAAYTTPTETMPDPPRPARPRHGGARTLDAGVHGERHRSSRLRRLAHVRDDRHGEHDARQGAEPAPGSDDRPRRVLPGNGGNRPRHLGPPLRHRHLKGLR